jgi:hypothetical protein
VVRKFEGGMSIGPLDSTRESLERFQPIAQQILQRESEEGYEVADVHRTDRYPGRPYDLLVLSFM